MIIEESPFSRIHVETIERNKKKNVFKGLKTNDKFAECDLHNGLDNPPLLCVSYKPFFHFWFLKEKRKKSLTHPTGGGMKKEKRGKKAQQVGAFYFLTVATIG